MLHEGQVLWSGPLDEIKALHHRLTLRFDAPQPQPPVMAGVLSITGAGQEWTVICNGTRAELDAMIAKLGARTVQEHAPSLNDIFVARAGHKDEGMDKSR